MPAEADPALHVAFQRNVDPFWPKATIEERCRRGLHHPFGAAHEGDGLAPVPAGAVEQVGDDADRPGPALARAIDGHGKVDVLPPSPRFEIRDMRPVFGRPSPVVEAHAAEPVAPREQFVDERAQWR